MTDQNKPTLIVHGHDEIVPIGASVMRSFVILNGAVIKVCPGVPQATCSAIKNNVYADLHPFTKEKRSASAH